MKAAQLLLLLATPALLGVSVAGQQRPAPPRSVRVYVFDCGRLDGGDPARFSLKREEMAVADMSVACFLVVHPKGTLMWDVGAVPDSAIRSEGTPNRHRIVLPNGNE